MRLTAADLALMRAEHVVDPDTGHCRALGCVRVPCDAARLLAHFAPGPVPHLAGIAAGLLGPVSDEELAR